jgi:hypothetical protein
MPVNRNLETRLRKLEADQAPPSMFIPWHRVIGDSDGECEAQRRGMIEAGQAKEADNFIFHIIVSPGASLAKGEHKRTPKPQPRSP